MTTTENILTVTKLKDYLFESGKYVILGFINNMAHFHLQSLLGYGYGMECKGQIVASTSVIKKVTRGFVSQEVHDQWAAKKPEELNKPWGIHHVQTGKESVHFLSAECLLRLLYRETPLAKAAENIKPISLQRLHQGFDKQYANDLIKVCEYLLNSEVANNNANRHEESNTSELALTFEQAAEAIQKFRQEFLQLEAEAKSEIAAIDDLKHRLSARNDRLNAINDRKIECHRGMIAAAQIMATFGSSILPVDSDPMLLV